ncbi:uncharacterized protein LOC121239109 isoform X2 [Juglans microcarpa x Juglans regia]|uniref:uncharacterized protein LOC121239109 isoform X2 n=1 Tax=Juglans microcarpa x Juglans regia TaxID=2249226 RepID=UPI001B7EA678|nr:uncharacterized protein LOC121239109 isoform X2 [Juglans microcarpa x Juglans regia]
MSYDNQQHPAPNSFHEVGNDVQRQTSPGNLHQGKPSTDVPSLDKVHFDCAFPPAWKVVQGQTSPGNLQEEKPSTDVPSLNKVVQVLQDSSGPVGGSVPGFPPKKEANCIRKCLAALSPCCG